MKTPLNHSEVSPNASEWLNTVPAALREDCLFLLCAHWNCDRSQLRSDPERLLSSADIDQLNDLVQRLQNDEPLAYLLGEQPFHALTLKVDSRVLVPRSDTETLVELALEHARQRPPALQVLDLGTGSGAIAIALACAAPGLRITATDASTDALTVAQENAAQCQASVQFRQSNWFSAVTEQYDLIVSNPPYIAANDPHLPALHHEPIQALVAGIDGLEDLRTIIADAPKHLLHHGTLMVEHGYDQAEAVAALFTAAGFTQVRCERDLGNRPRVTLGCRQEVG